MIACHYECVKDLESVGQWAQTPGPGAPERPFNTYILPLVMLCLVYGTNCSSVVVLLFVLVKLFYCISFKVTQQYKKEGLFEQSCVVSLW